MQKEILMAIWMQMETVTDWLMEIHLVKQKQMEIDLVM